MMSLDFSKSHGPQKHAGEGEKIRKILSKIDPVDVVNGTIDVNVPISL